MKDVEKTAERVFGWLMAERRAERVTVDKPATCARIISVAAQARVKLSAEGVREIMNHLRKNKYPVGSTVKGYFAIFKSGEFDVAIDHLTGRARDLEEQIRQMREAKSDMWKRENPLQPTGEQ